MDLMGISDFCLYGGIGLGVSVVFCKRFKLFAINYEKIRTGFTTELADSTEKTVKELGKRYLDLGINMVRYENGGNYEGKPVILTGKLSGEREFYEYLGNPSDQPIVRASGVKFERNVQKMINGRWAKWLQNDWDLKSFKDISEAKLADFEINEEVVKRIDLGRTIRISADGENSEWKFRSNDNELLASPANKTTQSQYKISYKIVPPNLDVTFVGCIEKSKLSGYNGVFILEEGILDNHEITAKIQEKEEKFRKMMEDYKSEALFFHEESVDSSKKRMDKIYNTMINISGLVIISSYLLKLSLTHAISEK